MYIYATIKDNDAKSDRINRYSPMLSQTYDNFLRAKDDPDRYEGVTNRFTISTDVKQHLTYILLKLVEELDNIDLEADDTVASITEKLGDVYGPDSQLVNFWALNKEKSFGPTLKSAKDETSWLHAQVTGLLPGQKTNTLLLALLSTEMDRALKSLAWIVGQHVWSAQCTSIDTKLFYSICAVSGFSLEILDEIIGNVREKVKKTVKSKSVKSATGDATAGDANVTGEDADATKDVTKDADATTATADATSKVAKITDEDVEKALIEV